MMWNLAAGVWVAGLRVSRHSRFRAAGCAFICAFIYPRYQAHLRHWYPLIRGIIRRSKKIRRTATLERESNEADGKSRKRRGATKLCSLKGCLFKGFWYIDTDEADTDEANTD
jgi:hypothetical protein